MKKIKIKRKISIVIFSILFIFIFLTGCNYFPKFVEIDDNFIVLALGIDKGIENKDNFRVTLVTKDLRETTDTKQEGGANKGVFVKFESATIFDAIRRIHTIAYKDVFYGHIEFIIIGEELARENINKTLDFIVRNYELRTMMPILIARGITAEEILDSEDEYENFVPNILDELLKNIGGHSISKVVSLKDVCVSFNSEYGDTIIGSIHKKNIQGENSKEITTIELDGYAVFNKFKLIDFLLQNNARGANFINNDINSGIIVIEDATGKKNSLEILEATSKIEPKYINNTFEANISIKVITNIDEIQNEENYFTVELIDEFNNKQKNVVLQEAQSALNFSQQNGVDIFNIGDEIYHKYPLKWDKIKDNWKEIYKQMKININVETKINGTHIIYDPIGVK